MTMLLLPAVLRAMFILSDISMNKQPGMLMIYLFKKMPIVAEQLRSGRIYGN